MAALRAAAFLALCAAAAAQPFSCAAGTGPATVGVAPTSQANCACAGGTVLKPASQLPAGQTYPRNSGDCTAAFTCAAGTTGSGATSQAQCSCATGTVLKPANQLPAGQTYPRNSADCTAATVTFTCASGTTGSGATAQTQCSCSAGTTLKTDLGRSYPLTSADCFACASGTSGSSATAQSQCVCASGTVLKSGLAFPSAAADCLASITCAAGTTGTNPTSQAQCTCPTGTNLIPGRSYPQTAADCFACAGGTLGSSATSQAQCTCPAGTTLRSGLTFPSSAATDCNTHTCVTGTIAGAGVVTSQAQCTCPVTYTLRTGLTYPLVGADCTFFCVVGTTAVGPNPTSQANCTCSAGSLLRSDAPFAYPRSIGDCRAFTCAAGTVGNNPVTQADCQCASGKVLKPPAAYPATGGDCEAFVCAAGTEPPLGVTPTSQANCKCLPNTGLRLGAAFSYPRNASDCFTCATGTSALAPRAQANCECDVGFKLNPDLNLIHPNTGDDCLPYCAAGTVPSPLLKEVTTQNGCVCNSNTTIKPGKVFPQTAADCMELVCTGSLAYTSTAKPLNTTCGGCPAGMSGVPTGPNGAGCIACDATKDLCPGLTRAPLLDLSAARAFNAPVAAACAPLTGAGALTAAPPVAMRVGLDKFFFVVTGYIKSDQAILGGIIVGVGVFGFYALVWMILHSSGAHPIAEKVATPIFRLMANMDQFSRDAWVDDGEPLVRRSRPVGGACFFLGLVSFVTYALVIILDREVNNLAIAKSANLLEAEPAAAAEILPFYASAPWGQGVQVRVFASGEQGACAAPLFSTQGAKEGALLKPDLTTGTQDKFVLAESRASCGGAGPDMAVFTCASCDLTAASSLQLTYHWSCQSFAIDVGALSATGIVSATRAAARLTRFDTKDNRRVKTLTVKVPVFYSVVNSTVGEFKSVRGYTVFGGSAPTLEYADAPTPGDINPNLGKVQVNIELPLDSFYTTTICARRAVCACGGMAVARRANPPPLPLADSQKVTTAALLSNLVGLLGILGLFRSALLMHDT